MPMDDVTRGALEIGRRHAKQVLAFRDDRLKLRPQPLETRPRAYRVRTRSVTEAGQPLERPMAAPATGVLVAEGDSWFDYPFHDVLAELEDRHGYDVESVAHAGDRIEQMAYGGNQLEELTRRIEKLVRRGVMPMAILLSGGGNDVAGTEFGMLLNHAQSAIAGLNVAILDGVVNQRVRIAYLTILSAVSAICQERAGKVIPILIHGYDYPVPDGRGFLGGWGPLPGPWLEPGFREKGFVDLNRRIELAHELIDKFNTMIEAIAGSDELEHVHYVDLRNTLRTGARYKAWWDNELHPTERGFRAVTEKFVAVLDSLA